MSATQRSWQGHLKVTARSNQLKIDENNFFLLFFLQLCPLKMSMMVQTNLNPTQSYTKHISRHYRGFIGVGRVLPHEITLMSALSDVIEIDKKTGRLFCFNQSSNICVPLE